MDYRLSDLLDLNSLQKMAHAHYRSAGMPIGIIDAVDGSILVGAGWQEICTKFHRANALSLKRCRDSDNYIKDRLAEGEACAYKCKNGLWDIGMSIIVAGQHLATLFLGQFFYEGEAPDRAFFAHLAERFGFDLNGYLAALDRVPVFSREKVQDILNYDKALVTFLSDLAERSLSKIQADQAIRDSERKLKHQAEFLQHLIDAMPYPIFYKDREGRYVDCNRAFEVFYGMRREWISGKTVFDIAPREMAEVYFQADNDLFSNPGTQIYESTLQSADGQLHDVIFHKATFTGTDGTPSGIVGAIVDITERKRAEAEREKLQDQLVLAQKMESIGRLAGGVAHDFNNMLAVILGNTELTLTKLGLENPMSKHLNEIRRAAERSADLTRQLLAFARKQTVAPKVLDINTTIGRVLSILRRLMGEHIDLIWRPGTEIWKIKIDPAQIDQILMNLAANARDAIDEVGTVTLETANVVADAVYCASQPYMEPGDYVTLVMADNGNGMDSETLSNIFDPFFTTKDKHRGTGLGLATVYGIVKQNNGFVHVYSEPGHGSSFKIWFPRFMGESEIDAMEEKPETITRGAETVLLVEDEPMLLELALTMLQDLGYVVISAATPHEAIRLAGEHNGQLDLLLTDVVMPEMNGRDLAQRLLSRHPDLRCLFMSGYTANVIAHHGILEGDLNFIQKPFTLELLADKVRQALT